MADYYRIQCEECDSESLMEIETAPEFCPVCGRRGLVEPLSVEREELDFDDD